MYEIKLTNNNYTYGLKNTLQLLAENAVERLARYFAYWMYGIWRHNIRSN